MKNRLRIYLIPFLLPVFVVCKDSAKSEDDKEELMIKNLGVTFAPWDRATNRAGDFIFSANERKVFLEFGALVGAGDGGFKELPTFEYRIDKNAFVFAIADGKVSRLVYQDETEDYEIGCQYPGNRDWHIGYDHVKNPRVKLGDRVTAGDTLGNPGSWSGQLGRFEIMINNSQTGLSYCPFCYFAAENAAFYQQLVLQHMIDWETFKGDTTIFNEAHHVYPGCRMESMVTY